MAGTASAGNWRREIVRWVRHACVSVLRESYEGRSPPAFHGARLFTEAYRPHQYRLNIQLRDGREFNMHLPCESGRWCADYDIDWTRLAYEAYSAAFEDHLLHIERERRRRLFIEFTRLNPGVIPPGTLVDIAHEFAGFDRHVGRAHRIEALDLAVPNRDRTIVDFGSLQAEASQNLDLLEPAARVAEVRARLELLALELRDQIDASAMAAMLFGRWDGPQVGDDSARAKGLILLKENLTPAQREQYEKNKHFEVTGCDTGKRSRITHGRQMNVYELDAQGNQVQGWCFLPQGQLVEGDVMLAQKVALENFEKKALKIANPFGGTGRGGGAGGAGGADGGYVTVTISGGGGGGGGGGGSISGRRASMLIVDDIIA